MASIVFINFFEAQLFYTWPSDEVSFSDEFLKCGDARRKSTSVKILRELSFALVTIDDRIDFINTLLFEWHTS